MGVAAPTISILETKGVKLRELRPYPANPRNGDIDLIRESVRVHGQYRALVVNRRDMTVLAGNHLLHALLAEGFTEGLCHLVDVDDEEAARIVLVDNRANDAATYDNGLLAELLQSLPDLSGTGYAPEDLDAILGHQPKEGLTDPDDVPELPKEAITRPGDLWLLGEHRLLCGDATKGEDYERLMAGRKADLIFTDPPYGVGYTGGAKQRDPLIADEVGTTIYQDSLVHFKTVASDSAALYLWYADAHVAAAAAAAAGYQVSAQIIWVKNNAQFVSAAHYKGKHEPCFYAHRRGKSAQWHGPNNEVTVWEVSRAARNDYHPTQKPVDLAARAMRNSSAPRQAVLDPFAGSGSTLIAAEQEGRIAYCLEIDPLYCDVICRRYQEFSGTLPILESTGQERDFSSQG